MNIIMDIILECTDPGLRFKGGSHCCFRRKFESDIIPTMGVKIEDPAWKDSKKIKGIVINYSQGYCYVNLGLTKLPTIETFELCQRALKDNGWKDLGNL